MDRWCAYCKNMDGSPKQGCADGYWCKAYTWFTDGSPAESGYCNMYRCTVNACDNCGDWEIDDRIERLNGWD